MTVTKQNNFVPNHDNVSVGEESADYYQAGPFAVNTSQRTSSQKKTKKKKNKRDSANNDDFIRLKSD